MATVEEMKSISTQIRRDILRMVHACSSGHPGGSLGCADLFTVLYFDQMEIKTPFDMNGENEDLFFLSNGHISPVFYSTLARRGFFSVDELSTFRRLNTRLQGHPTTHEGLEGIRVASGSLGQGISVACGAALTKKMKNDAHKVFVLCGDGELQEGQIWEALLFANQKKLNNLIAIVDWNGQQIDGTNDDVITLGDLPAKWTSFGWETYECDGNDIAALQKTIQEAKSASSDAPKVILMKTVMGKGVDFMENNHQWHGVAPSDAQLEAALTQLPETLGDYKNYTK